jgi:hypothetical protein
VKPVALSTEELSSVLDDMKQTIANRDSFEGNIQYSCLEGPVCVQCGGSGSMDGLDGSCGRCFGDGVEPLGEGKDFWVRAVFRVGNSEGQGGVRMVGEVPS